MSALAIAGLLAASSVFAGDLLPPGYRPLPLGTHALVGGRVFIKPGQTLENGTIIIRDGLIQAVGKDAAIPADARVWDMKGTAIYAGFIDPYVVMAGESNRPVSTGESEPISEMTYGGVKFYGAPGARTDMGKPGPSYEVSKISPDTEAVKSYTPDARELESMRELGFTAASFTPGRGIIRGTSTLAALAEEDPNNVIIKPEVFQHVAFETRGEESGYPGSLMGAIAVVRQSFFDAQHYALDHADYARHPQGRKRPEYNPGAEALEPALSKAMPVAFEPGSVLMDDRAAQVSRELGLNFVIVACGQEWRRPDLVKQTGAAFIVPLNFPTLPHLPSPDDWEQVSLDQLRAWDWAPENPALLRQQGLEVALTTYGLEDKKDFRKNLRLALDRGLSEADALAALTTEPAKLCGVENQLGTIEAGKVADLTVVSGTNYFDPEAKVREVWIDGRIYPSAPAEPKETKGAETNALAGGKGGATNAVTSTNAASGTNALASKRGEGRGAKKAEETREFQKKRLARSPMEGRGPIVSPATVVIRRATIWTCGPAGVLSNADMLVSGGKIREVGALSGAPPADALVIDAAGQSVSPGIIDCHSHSFIVGGVNEGTLPSTAMVRINDVINSETANFHEQLAGGVVEANVLHGSANPIGGQVCVIKLRDGESPEELLNSNAIPGIKFALGENVKQSNWGDENSSRYPQTRMGVRAFYLNRFTAAQEYLKAWDDYRKFGAATNAVPPRRDLELEALGEILQGKRLIHCHAYRQDEMLSLLRLMQDFGVQIGTFQHVLEGYKIADELAAGKVGGSTFADWWAYKFEVYDAIPYNGAIMRDRGVVVSYNSDSSDFARRLYLEAAKGVKYGGVSETEALKFVTLNPAIQLRIDKWVGSLEPGKDADFVIWSRDPLDSATVCQQTWIDGKKYFDRSLEADRVARLKKERDDLIAKAKKLSRPGGGEDEPGDKGASFFQVALEHQFDGVDRYCLDEE